MPSTLPTQQTWPLGEAIYRQFLDSFVDEMYLHDDQGVLLDVNPAACHNLGYTREELLGMPTAHFSGQYTPEALLKLWSEHPVGLNVVEPNRHRRRDGSSYPVEVHIACQEFEGRKYFLALARHTEEKHRREQEVLQLNSQLQALVQERTRKWRESSRLLETLMEQTPDTVFIKDMEGRYQYVNQALARRLERPVTDILGRTDADLFTPEMADSYRQSDLQTLERDTALLLEERLQMQGRTRIFNIMKTPYRDEENRVVGLLGMARDISDMRKAQEQMESNYEMLRQAERIAQTGSWTLDLTTGHFTNSEMLAEMNGNRPGDPPLTPDSLRQVLEPEDHARLTVAINECIAHGTPYCLDMPHRRPEGGSFPCRIRGQAYLNADGAVTMLHGTVQNLTEHKEAQERLESLADNLPNGAIFRCEQVDKLLLLRYVSAGVQHLLGLSAQAMVNIQSTFLHAIHPEDVPVYLARVKECLRTQTTFDTVCRVRHADGRMRWIRNRATPRRTHNALLWEGLLLDVTQEHEAQQALQNAKEAAEAAEKAKSEFLATMSHEIRTPMNTVIGMTQLLQQTPMAPKQRNYLDKVALSANALLSIINDILDFSKLEADMLSLAPESFSLDTLLETVSAVTSLRAEQKGLEIVYGVDASVPRQLVGDAQRLSQVLTNLIGNAIKFTERGEVVIQLHASTPEDASDARSRILQVSVRDTGIGMQPEHLTQLFQPFTQAEAHISRRYGGTGLGLAISRRLIQLMGGDIEVRSTPGVGSEFRFHIRIQADQAPAQGKSLTMPQCRVLVVDDNAMARDILCGMVQGFGLPCDTAASGFEALQCLETAAAQAEPYHLVLMDWRMPGMDGLEAAQRIRQHDQLHDTPAMLMVTAYCRDEVLERVSTLGLQGLLIKPVTESALFNAMHDTLHDPQFALLRQPSDAALQPLQIPLALRGAQILVVDDNALNREVARDFLHLAGIEVTTAASGRDALALLQQQGFDAVLLDVQMPEMDGLEVARRIRLQPQWQDLPVLALTAQARVEDRSAILASGMNGHLTKPLDAQLLFNTLCQVLGRSGDAAPVSMPDTAALHTAASTPPPHPTQDVLGRQLAHDPERAQRLLQSFVRDFAQAPQQLHSHFQAQDWRALHLLAHTLKGSLGYLHAPQAVEALQTLESASAPPHAATAQCAAQVAHAAAALEQVLQQVARALQTSAPAPGAPAHATSPEQLQEWIAQALPRIQQGDYAGLRLLEQIEASLRTQPLHALAARALAQAEDLDNEAACHSLRALHAALAAPTAQRETE